MLTTIDNLRILKQAEEIAGEVWAVVEQWHELARDTVGKQLVRAADSIGANIAEMHGRFNYGEKIQFLYYSRGSLFETKYWLNRVSNRNLTDRVWVTNVVKRLLDHAQQLNAFISATKDAKREVNYSRQVKESSQSYDVEEWPSTLFTEDDLRWLAKTDREG